MTLIMNIMLKGCKTMHCLQVCVSVCARVCVQVCACVCISVFLGVFINNFFYKAHFSLQSFFITVINF